MSSQVVEVGAYDVFSLGPGQDAAVKPASGRILNHEITIFRNLDGFRSSRDGNDRSELSRRANRRAWLSVEQIVFVLDCQDIDDPWMASLGRVRFISGIDRFVPE
jgi:hypothetical protein